MDIPAFGIIMDLGETNTLNSVLQCMLAYEKFTELVLFNIEYKTKPMLNALQEVFEKLVQYKCIVKPKTLYSIIDQETVISTSTDPKYIIESFIEQLGKTFRLDDPGKVRFSKNVAQYFSVLQQLNQAIDNNLPQANKDHLNNEYLFLRNKHINEILNTTSLCVWNKACENISSKILNLFFGQKLVTTRCSSCTYNDYTFKMFSVFDIPDGSSDQIQHSMEELMSKASDVIDTTDCCKMCSKAKCTRQTVIMKNPKCLIVRLGKKNPLVISTDFNLTTFNNIVDPQLKITYRLFALTCVDGANYSTYSKRGDQWHRYSSNNGNCITISSISNIKIKQPTLLFYTME